MVDLIEVSELVSLAKSSVEDFWNASHHKDKLSKEDIGEVLNIYQFGSRVCGCETEDSDYDFLCIIDGKYFERVVVKDVTKSVFMQDENSNTSKKITISASTMHWETFQKMMDKNEIWIYSYIFEPARFIKMEQRPIRYPYVYYMNLRNSIITDGRHCKKKARRLYVEEHDTHKGLKNIVHAIRFFCYGMQLLEHGRVVDFTEGNNIYNMVFNTKIEDWNKFENEVVEPLYKDYSERFLKMLPKWDVLKQNANLPANASVHDYFAAIGLEEYCKLSCLYIRRLPYTTYQDKFLDLIAVEADRESSPLYSRAIQDSKGLLVAFSNFPQMIQERTSNLIHKSRCGNVFTILAKSHQHFFEHDDKKFAASTIDWAQCKVVEWIDGVEVLMYYFDGAWRISSLRTPDASDIVIGLYPFRVSVSSLFWETWKELGCEFPPSKTPQDQSKCYIFQVVSLKNPQVVIYSRNRIVLDGIIDMNTLQEISTDGVDLWETPEVLFDSTTREISLTFLLEFTRNLNPLHSLGCIVVDHQFNRIRITALRYKLLQSLQVKDVGSIPVYNFNMMLDLVRMDADGNRDYMEKFPEWLSLYEMAQEQYLYFCEQVQQVYDAYKHIPVKKEFSKNVKKHNCHEAVHRLAFANDSRAPGQPELSAKDFFAYWTGFTSIRQYIKTVWDAKNDPSPSEEVENA